MSSLFVGGISFKATEDDIRDFFSRAGISSEKINISTDRETGMSKGFGFVDLRDPNQADEAIRRLYNTDFMGRTITVAGKTPAPGGFGGGGGGGGERGPYGGGKGDYSGGK